MNADQTKPQISVKATTKALSAKINVYQRPVVSDVIIGSEIDYK